LRARPIGALHISDSKGEEHNVLAVPDDPRFSDIGALENLPDEILREIEQFFEVYKRLEGDEEAQICGWQGYDDTQEPIRKCMQASAYVETDDFDSYQPYSVCALHSGGIESDGHSCRREERQ
jgi:inorganic pyrophosphatase